MKRWGDTFLVLLDRSDSSFWLADQVRTKSYLADAGGDLELLADERMSATYRLRIWQVRGAQVAR